MLIQFQNLLDELKETSSKSYSHLDKLNAFLRLKNQKTFKKHFPKRKKYNFDLIKGIPEYVEYSKRLDKIGSKFWTYWHSKKSKIQNKLFELAQNLIPQKTNEFILWKRVSSSSYSSQGFSCAHYTKQNAESYADKARFNNLEVEIREIDQGHDNRYGIQYKDYEVWVKTNEIGLEILNYGKDISLVEQVRLDLKRGVNPRVNRYWLPYDFEEKNGLDFFGNYIKI